MATIGRLLDPVITYYTCIFTLHSNMSTPSAAADSVKSLWSCNQWKLKVWRLLKGCLRHMAVFIRKLSLIILLYTCGCNQQEVKARCLTGLFASGHYHLCVYMWVFALHVCTPYCSSGVSVGTHSKMFPKGLFAWPHYHLFYTCIHWASFILYKVTSLYSHFSDSVLTPKRAVGCKLP